jgi:transcriptional regulator with XRE-family HTH domain
MRLLSDEEIVEGERRRQSASALPRNLKRLMDAHAWTVGRLSKASGVKRSTIRNVLKAGKAHNHTLDVLLRLAEALGVGIQDLVEDRDA